MRTIIRKKGIVISILFLFFGFNIVPFTNIVKADIIWDVSLNFNEPGGKFDYVIFGEASDANDGPPADIHDVAKPPAPMPPYIRASLKDNLPTPYSNLWRDYRYYPDTEKTWNLTIQWVPEDGVSSTTITFTWSITEVDDSEYSSVDLCTNLGVVLKNMLSDSSYSFVCPANVIQNFKIICTMNAPPEFGVPSPVNNSINNPLAFTWNLPITDPEGDTVSWSIQCSDGQSTSGSGAGGTKNLPLSGLAYETSYKVWVNATDSAGSGQYTRRWYTFTTKQSLPPVFGTPSPSNGSDNNPVSFSWSIPISDPEGDVFSWSIQCSNGQSVNGASASNGTKNLGLTGLSYETTYTVWVNATDSSGSGLYLRRWYTFSSKSNLPPVLGAPTPVNNSGSQPLSFTWGISISDPEGNTFTWSIQCSNGQVNSGTGASNGTKSLALSGLAYATTFKVWVNATDPTGSGMSIRRWFSFTTKTSLPPVFGTPTPLNGSTGNPISFMWNIPISDPDGNTFSWSIQCSNGQSNSGSSASNGTKSVSLTNLAYVSTYKVWVNATDPSGSGVYTRRWYTFTTKANLPPVFGTPSPANGSVYQLLSFTWSIPLSDPDGNTFTWSIQCSNGQTISSSGSNGTKSLPLTGLTYITTYKVWVNATDTTGSGLTTRRWYTFTTRALNNPPVYGTPSPTNGSTNTLLSLTWGIPINDLEGNTFTWSIQCSNGQSNSGTTAVNGTKTVLLSGLAYGTSYKVWANATDPSGSGQYTRRWYTFTTQQQNLPPSPPNTPIPTNGSSGAAITSNLHWSGGDPNGDTVLYDVYFGSSNPPVLVNHNQSSLSYDLGTLNYATTYYWMIVAWDNHSLSTSGPIWRFTTTASSGGGGGGGGGGDGGTEPPVTPPNIAPVANVTAGEPYQGFVDTLIMFNASHSYDSDGVITSWFWEFGDATNGTGMTVTHTYSEKGTFTVTLTVTDDDGALDNTTTLCVILQPNQPPLPPSITGPINGTRNTAYTFTAVATDPDNDLIQYTFDWGDSLIQPSSLLSSGMSFSVDHGWATAGRYRFTVTVSDNQTFSSSEFIIYIDAVPVEGIGYLLDNDSDGTYDAFYSNDSQQIFPIQKQEDHYTIDQDGDGDWDVTYSTTTGITPYQEPTRTYGLEIIIAVLAIALYLLWRRRSKKKQ